MVENNSAGDNYVEIPLFYYDGYSAYSVENDMYLPVQPGVYGVVRVVVPPSVTGEILVQFGTKWFFKAAQAISWASVLLVAVYFGIKYRKNKLKTR